MSNLDHSSQGMKKLVHNGQVMILFAVASLVLIGAVALAVDVGFLLAERRQVQAAADSAALAAAQSGLDNNAGQIVSAARSYGAVNANVAESAVSVDPDAPAPSGGDGERYVEVSIIKEVQKFFLGAIYPGDWSVTASAVAAIEDDPVNYALLALNAPGIHIPGNASVLISGNGASAMSNDNIARNGVANSFVVDGSIDAHGTIDEHGGWSAPDGFNEGKKVLDDPIVDAGVQPPLAGSLPLRTLADISPANCFSGPPTNCALLPGYYRDLGNLVVRRTWTLQPGVYYFQGTSVSFENTMSRIQGSEVAMYFNGPASTTYLFPKNGEIAISGPASSPYSGGLAGMALWIANCTLVDASGNTKLQIQGIWYSPCSRVDLHGTPSNETTHGQMIVGSLNVVGNSQINITYEHYVDTMRPKVFLVE